MKHRALDELYDIVPHFKHEDLNLWVNRWVGVAYAKSTMFDPHRESHVFDGVIKTLQSGLGREAAERCVTNRQSFVEPPPGYGIVFSAECFFLNPEPKP